MEKAVWIGQPGLLSGVYLLVAGWVKYYQIVHCIRAPFTNGSLMMKMSRFYLEQGPQAVRALSLLLTP